MRVTHVRLALLAGAILVPIAGCARSTTGDFRSYNQLESTAPAKTNGTTLSPADSAAGSPEPEAVAGSPADAPPNGAASPAVAPSPESDVVATAELPVRLLMDRAPAASAPAAPDSIVAEAELPVTTVTVAASPRKVELLVPNRDFRKLAGALQMTYDDIDLLKVLNMDPVTPDAVKLMPSWLKGLDGQRIRVRGFMYPPFQETGLSRFVLARDNQICCFGRNPKIYDLIDVSMKKDVTTDYIQNRPFDVVGVFRIKPDGDDERLFQLYFIEDAVVIER